MQRLALYLAIALASCAQSPADEALGVCHALCRCTDVALPGEQRDCIAVCSQQFEQHPLSDACAACAVEHADRCPILLDDCGPICTEATPR